jgi:hypothetical protein
VSSRVFEVSTVEELPNGYSSLVLNSSVMLVSQALGVVRIRGAKLRSNIL